MMKKLIAVLMIAVLALSCTAALAAVYTDPDRDITFEYDETQMEVSYEDVGDDELLVIVSFKDEALSQDAVKIHYAELDDGETFPKAEDFAEIAKVTGKAVEQLETWAQFRNVFTYSYEDADPTETVFVAPVYDDDDDEVEGIVTVTIFATKLADEEAAMARDDAISEVVDTLKVLED